MIKTSIYFGNRGEGLGGAESTILAMAAELECHGTVDIFHRKLEFSVDLLSDRFGRALQTTRFIKIDDGPIAWDKVHNPVRRLKLIREVYRHISAGYDLFIAVGHNFPPFAYGGVNIVHTLFPDDWPGIYAPAAEAGAGWLARIRRVLNGAYYSYEIRSRLGTYHDLTANSEYTASWCRQRWGGKAWKVWHPPVAMVGGGVNVNERKRRAVAVGRITPVKRQHEMALWSREGEINLTMIGGASSHPMDQQYLNQLQGSLALQWNLLLVDCPLEELQQTYRKCRVFWHATGYEVPENKPDMCEHFGMTTVEAMSAGCVPVVFDRGGQAEIVRHGVDGFRWTSPKELLAYTKQLFDDDVLWSRMSIAAIERAKEFSLARFNDRIKEFVRRALATAPNH